MFTYPPLFRLSQSFVKSYPPEFFSPTILFSTSFAKEKSFEKEEIKNKLKDYRSLQSVINLWKKLTESQQDDTEIKEWFTLKRQQLKDEGIYA